MSSWRNDVYRDKYGKVYGEIQYRGGTYQAIRHLTVDADDETECFDTHAEAVEFIEKGNYKEFDKMKRPVPFWGDEYWDFYGWKMPF